MCYLLGIFESHWLGNNDIDCDYDSDSEADGNLDKCLVIYKED